MKQVIENQPAFRRKRHQVSFQGTAVISLFQSYGLVAITFLTFFPALFHFQEYAFVFLLAIGVSLSWIEHINPLVRTPIDLPLFGFIGWVLCTVPFAIDPAYSFSEWRKFVAHVLVFYWGTSVLRRHDNDGKLTGHIIWAIVLGSLVLSALALADFVLRGGTWRDRLIRAAAPNSDYNWLTTYLVLVIPILIAWVSIRHTFRTRMLGVVTVLLAGIAQMAAYTRAGWVAHIVQAVGFVLAVRRYQWIIWFVTASLVVGSAALIALSWIGYQQETLDPWTFSARIKTWRLGFEQVLEHPLVGVGFGNDTFSKIYAAEIEADRTKGPVEKVLPALHNTFAMVLAGSGVPALFFLLWTMLRVIQKLVSGISGVSLREARVLLLPSAIALSVLGFMVRNAFDYMFAGSLATLFWILVAVGFSIRDNHSRQSALLDARSQPGAL